MRHKFARLIGCTALFSATVFSPALYAQSPALEHLKTSLASVQQGLNDPQLAGDQHRWQRRKLVRTILQQLFDFDEMSRRSLGSNARRYKDRLTEFTPLFVDFLEHAYLGTLEQNGDAKIHYVKEINDGENVQINTRTELRDGSEYDVNYKFYLNTVGWRVYDVSVEGISLVNSYRSQFNRVLNRKSFDELLQDLRAKKELFN